MVQRQQSYDERSKMFLEAVAIGDAIISATGMEEHIKRAVLNFSNHLRNVLSDPEQKFRNLKSLAYAESDYFTYWNESAGEHIEKFWKEISDRSLPFTRNTKDVVGAVLKRKKIRNHQEYEHLVDGIVIFQQEGRITQDEMILLSKYIVDYENKMATMNAQNEYVKKAVREHMSKLVGY